VKYEEKTKAFNQTSVIAALGDKWKIVSDCFRMQELLDVNTNTNTNTNTSTSTSTNTNTNINTNTSQ